MPVRKEMQQPEKFKCLIPILRKQNRTKNMFAVKYTDVCALSLISFSDVFPRLSVETLKAMLSNL